MKNLQRNSLYSSSSGNVCVFIQHTLLYIHYYTQTCARACVCVAARYIYILILLNYSSSFDSPIIKICYDTHTHQNEALEYN